MNLTAIDVMIKRAFRACPFRGFWSTNLVVNILLLIVLFPGRLLTQHDQPVKEERVLKAYQRFQSGDTPGALRQLDSIKQNSLTTGDHEVLFQAIEYQATIYTFSGKQDSALRCYQEGIRQAQEVNDLEEELNFHLNEIGLRRMLNEKGDPQRLRTLINKAQNHPREQSMLLQELATHQVFTLSNFDSAVHYLDRSLKLAEGLQDSIRISAVLRQFGDVYQRSGAYLMSIDYTLKSIEYISNPLQYFNGLHMIGTTFYQLQQYDKAHEYITRAYEFAQEHNYQGSMAKCQYTMGSLAYIDNDLPLAKSSYHSALGYYDAKPLHDGRASVRISLLKCYLDLDQLDSAQYCLNEMQSYYDRLTDRYKGRFHYAKGLWLQARQDPTTLVVDEYLQALELVRKANDVEVEMDILKALQEALARTNPSQALRYSNLREALNDSLFEITKTQMLFDLEAQYQRGEQEKQIAALDAENQINSIQLNARNRQLLLLIFGLLGLLILAFVLYRNARIRRKVNRQLNQKNDLISKALNEKDTLLREIHHRVKNNLQVISSLLALQSKYIRDDSALDALRQGQDRVQSMALIHQDLYQADNLKGVDTQSYFQQLVENLFESYRIDEEEINLELDVEPLMLDVDTMIPLGLVLNELVSNALKHAFAHQQHGEIKVTLKEVGEYLLLEVEDNGSGIDDVSILEGKSFGFELVKAFAQKLKAEMEINKEGGLGISLKINEYKKAA